MDPNNTGSFGAAIGGASALKEAFARRGKDASILDQVSPASIGGASEVPVAPEGAPTSQTAGVTAPTPSQPEAPDSELKIALKALGGFVQSEGKMRRDLVTMRGQGAV